MILSISFLLPLALAPRALAAECVLAGPGFPAPSRMSNSSELVKAISQIESMYQDAKMGLQASDVAWTIAVFSSKQDEIL